LAVGEHDIRLAAQSGNGLSNIDSLKISGASVAAVSCSTNDREPLPDGVVRNPIDSELDNFYGLQRGSLEADKLIADAMLAFQLNDDQVAAGCYPKSDLNRYARGIPTAEEAETYNRGRRYLASIDNLSNSTEMTFVADIYQRTGDVKYLNSLRKQYDCYLAMQGESGGFPQYFPDRSKEHYSNHATFNDTGMMRIMIQLQKGVKNEF